MADELCASLLAHGRRGRTIGIKVRLDDFTTVTRAHSIAEPTCDGELVTAVALRLLREYAPARPVRLLGVRVAGLGSSPTAAFVPGDSPGDCALGPGSSRRGGAGRTGRLGVGEPARAALVRSSALGLRDARRQCR